MYDQALFDRLIGPTLTRTQIAALPSGPAWLNGFDVGSEDQWTRFLHDITGTNGDALYPTFGDKINFSLGQYNYYGRDHAYAAMYKMSNYSVQKYYDRALAIAQWNFDNYFEENMGVSNPFLQMIMSMTLLYAMTGNPSVLAALGRNGDLNRYGFYPLASVLLYGSSPGIFFQPPNAEAGYPMGWWTSSGGCDPRTKARPHESFILNHLINAPSTGAQGGAPGGNNWLTCARDQLTAMLASQDITGSWRDSGNVAWQNYLDPGPQTDPGRAGTLASPMLEPTFAVHPFETGMMHDTFQMHYDMIEPDSRIVPAMVRSMNYLQNGGTWLHNTGPLYVSAQKCYKYIEFASGIEGYDANGSNILNGFMVNNAAFLYRTGQGTAWKTLAENMMSVIVPADLTGTQGYISKIWNQVYSRSYKAWPMLYGAAPSTPGGIPDGDITFGGWKNELGGTLLYPSIGETTPDNATYIYSGTGANDICEVSLSDPAGAIANGPIKYRYGKRLNNGVVVNLRVRLMQGATEIAHWDHANIPFAPVDVVQTLTAPQFAAITTPANLRLQFVRDAP